MITLNATTESLQAVLSAPVATAEPIANIAYADTPSTGAGGNSIAFNGTTAITLASAPAANTQRCIRTLSIYNADSATITFQIYKAAGAGNFPYHKITLPAGYNASLEGDGGWRITDANGNFLETVQAKQSGSWAVSVTGTVAVTQNGSWTTGRTWALSSSTDSIDVVQGGSWTVAATQSGPWTVQQGGSNWTFNLSQVNAVALGSPSAYGTAPTGNVLGVNAFVTNFPTVYDPLDAPTSLAALALTTTNQTFGTSAAQYINQIIVDLLAVTSTANVTIQIFDGGNNAIYVRGFGVISSATTIYNVIHIDNMRLPLNNAGNPPYAKLANALTSGSVDLTIGFR